jgi:hypothetical protein
MPTLTGTNALDPGGYTIEHLETILNRDLQAAPYLTMFAPCGGVDLLHDQMEALRHVNSKRPFCFLEVADLRIAPDCNTPGETAWLLEVSIEVATSDSTAPYEAQLKAALLIILNKAFEELIALGLEGNEIRAGQGRDQRPDRINPHTFSCEIFTQNA